MIKAIDFIKDSSENFKQEDVVIKGNNEKEYTIKISKKIKDTDIMEIVDSLVLRSDMCKKEKIKFDTVMSMYALMIKVFTDIKFSTYPNLKKVFSHEIDMLKALIDLGLLEQILLQFDKEEVNKIQDTFIKYSESYKAINNNIISQSVLGGEEDGEVSI